MYQPLSLSLKVARLEMFFKDLAPTSIDESRYLRGTRQASVKLKADIHLLKESALTYAIIINFI